MLQTRGRKGKKSYSTVMWKLSVYMYTSTAYFHFYAIRQQQLVFAVARFEVGVNQPRRDSVRSPRIQSAPLRHRSGRVAWPMSRNVPVATAGNRLCDTKEQSIMGACCLHYACRNTISNFGTNKLVVANSQHISCSDTELQCCWIPNSDPVRRCWLTFWNSSSDCSFGFF